eukprot:227605_1
MREEEADENLGFSEESQALSFVFGICRPVEHFTKICRIGAGAYGTVYKGYDRTTGTTVALKRVILHNESSDGFPLTSLREVALLKALSHPNCVSLLEVVVGRKRDSVFLVFEYCEYDMARLLESKGSGTFTLAETKRLVISLLRALSYLHDRWIIHRDLKMSNLLYNSRGQLKLADFGLARTCGRPPQPLTPLVVTLWYRAPELLLGLEAYTMAIDMWAAGCIVAELIRGEPILPGKYETDQLRKICTLFGSPSARIWPDLPLLPGFQKAIANGTLAPERRFNSLGSLLPDLPSSGIDLLDGLLTYDPEKRLVAEEAADHAFFQLAPLAKEERYMPTFPTTQ